MKFNFYLVLIFILTFSFTNAQKSIKIEGIVVEEGSNIPLEYATVVVKTKENSKIITGGITDAKGKFKVEIPSGNYIISIEYISYKTKTFPEQNISKHTDLGTIKLALDEESLDEVMVVAERTTVEIKLDKKVYNIGKDLTTAGGTVSDALNNVPSVTVDVEGAISLRGNENVRILINGKPSAMAGFGDSNVLSQLPADAIERVEVITSPSARYDAEGTAGILNIILRQKETLGFNGSVTLTAGNPDNVGVSAALNYRKEKYNLFSNFGWRYFDAPRTSLIDVNYFDSVEDDGSISEPEYRRIIENQDVDRIRRNYNANVGMEYFLSETSSITGSIFYNFGTDADVGLNSSERINNAIIVEETLRRERETEESDGYQIAVNYAKQFGEDSDHKLTVDFQFEKDKEDAYTYLNEDYVFTNDTDAEAFQIEQEFTNEDQKEYLIQADYVLPLGKSSRFEAGYRGNFKNSITDYQLDQENFDTGELELNESVSNIFDYNENVNAFYTQYGTKLGKFSFLLGLRLENTQLKGDIDSRLTEEELNDYFGFPIETNFDKNYLGLFPTVNLIYNLNKADSDIEESITLGFNRRINRPRGRYINPFPSRSSRTNIWQGNPNLDPAFSSTFDLGYLKRWEKFTLTSSIYYQHETDSFERVQENTGQQTTDGIDIIRTIPINLSSNDRTGVELGLMYTPAKWLRLNSSFNFFQFETEGEFNGVDYSAKNTSWFARFSSKVSLPLAIDWQTSAFYRGPRQEAQTDAKGIFSLDLAFSKEILKKKGTLALNVRDLFNSRKYKATTTTDFFERYNEFQWRQRQINASFTYRFNQKLNKRERSGQRGNDGDDFDFEG
ncbi:outer membrane beta-barrel protein [Winogradskyella litoriviva]|uniref:Outer membrane beta-barrel protein n=1 Tax=Winogradskyella litoriviva TaxID=1220182 RepID=A0ABX2E1X2_9FLAO|nr:outer membrane beta-barrel protein [Winogradskyella litoriviva]NRD22483.1 outer membrane beta-barrel protein [Winogradskyella litoriviva]